MKRWVCMLLLWPALAVADYKSDYRDGVAAAERGEWARVKSLMTRALAEQPEPNPKMRLYGMRFEAYIPQFYLGLAEFSTNQCGEALKWLEDARTVQAVQGLARDNQRRAMMVQRCRARLANQSPTESTTAAQPPATAPTSATKPPQNAPTPTRPPVVAPAKVSLDPARVQAVRRRLSAVEVSMAAINRALADPLLSDSRANWQRQSAPLVTEAQRAGARLRDLETRADAAGLSALDTELASLEQRSAALAKDLAGSAERARGAALADSRTALEASLATAQTTLAGVTDRSTAAALALERALSAARAALGATDATQLQRARDALDLALRGLQTAQARADLVARVRPRLRPLIASFLRGEYAKVAATSDDAALNAVPAAKAQATLIRAAARYELYVLDGERDLARIEAARADIRAARALVGGLQPSMTCFSPRFRLLFDSTR